MPNLVENCISRPQIDCMPARRWERLHLGDTGKLYQKVPLKFFAWLTGINLKRTFISTEDFLKLVATAKYLHVQLTTTVERRMLCENIWPGNIQSESVPWSLEKHKHFFQRTIDRSFCFLFMLLQLCTRNPCKLKGTQARRKRSDLLFLVKTFPRLGNGKTDTLEGDSFWCAERYFWFIFRIFLMNIYSL